MTGNVLCVLFAVVVTTAALASTCVLWKQASGLAREVECLHRQAAGGAPRPVKARGQDPTVGQADPHDASQPLFQLMALPAAPLRIVEQNGAMQFTKLDDDQVIPRERLTLINLWASWCPPCLAELPRLKRLFDTYRADFGDDVRFLPVLVNESMAPEMLLRVHQDDMPPFRSFAADLPGFTEQLMARGLYRGSLPVSALVGCNHQVRWIHFGEIKDSGMAPLTTVIATLLQDVRGHGCALPVGRRVQQAESNCEEEDCSCAGGCPGGFSCEQGTCMPDSYRK